MNAQVHELPQSHCGDNREGALDIDFMIAYNVSYIFTYYTIFINIYIYIKTPSEVNTIYIYSSVQQAKNQGAKYNWS